MKLHIPQEFIVRPGAVTVGLFLIQKLPRKVKDVVEIRNQDLVFEAVVCSLFFRMNVVILLLSFHMVTVVHCDFPNALEYEFAFTEADLSTHYLVLAFFVIALNVLFIGVIVPCYASLRISSDSSFRIIAHRHI